VRLWLGMGVLVAALAAVSPLTAAGSRAAGTCSMAEADKLAEKFDMGDSSYGRVGQVLCGPFAGPGSNVMAFSFHWYGCVPVRGWAVFRFTGGDWQLAMRRDREAAVLAAVGSDLRATVDVFRTGDSLCIPTGGTRSRVWRWNGKEFVGGPWKQLTPAKRSTKTSASFYSPSRNLSCGMWDDRRPGPSNGVRCESGKKPQRVTMGVDGRLGICRGQRCIGNIGENTPTLAYGKQITIGRFRCFSLKAGVKCIVISSSRGFLINATGITKVG
jgi:hypothetical protein